MPAMVCMIAGPNGRAANLHCTFLTSDGRKAEAEPVKRVMRGPLPEGAAVRLGKAQKMMGVAEGIETAMAASILHKMIPVWATVNGTMLGKWSPPPEAEMIFI
jgi:putative DNA primase/helicase